MGHILSYLFFKFQEIYQLYLQMGEKLMAIDISFKGGVPFLKLPNSSLFI